MHILVDAHVVTNVLNDDEPLLQVRLVDGNVATPFELGILQ
jgi:hypothetical protein